MKLRCKRCGFRYKNYDEYYHTCIWCGNLKRIKQNPYEGISQTSVIHTLDFIQAIDEKSFLYYHIKNDGYWNFNCFLFKNKIVRFAILEKHREEMFPSERYIKITTYDGISLVEKRGQR